jgi:hypothetical protein
MDAILEQLGSPVGIGVALVVVVVVLFLLRKLTSLIFLVAAVGLGGWGAARQFQWDIPFVLPGAMTAIAQDVADRVTTGPSSSLAAEADAQPEALGRTARSLGAAAAPTAAAEEAAGDVQRAEIRYNAPATMQLNMPIDLRLVVDPSGMENPESLLEGLPGEVREGQADLTRQVTATLTGSGFDIRPLKPSRQVLAGDRASTWQWEVTPREGGVRTLFLEVFAHPGGGDAAASVREFRDDIDVQVTFMSRALGFAQTTQPAVGFGAGAVSLLLAGVGLVRRRRRVI